MPAAPSSLNEPPVDDDISSFFANILKPGSFLHPTFLLIVDCAFLGLFVLFVILAFLTSGNPHIFALMGIELCLWISVKWFVYELKKTAVSEGGGNGKPDTNKGEVERKKRH